MPFGMIRHGPTPDLLADPIRMADEHLWYELACLAYAGRFPIQAYLVVRYQLGGCSPHIPHVAKQFPFLDEPIKAVVPPNIAAAPTGMGQLSRELREIVSMRLSQLSVPKILYTFSATSPELFFNLHEGGAGVNVLPEGWKPGAEERN